MSPPLIIVGILIVGLFLCVPTTHAASWDYYQSITVTSTLTIASGTQTNFPLQISIASSTYLQSTSTGGDVYSANGYDITFGTSTTCASPLDFITLGYASSSGQFIAEVSMPSMTAGSVIYMCYGNPAITSAQASSSITGDSSLVGYWPINEGVGSTTVDQSGNGNAGTWHGTSIGTNNTHYTSGNMGPYAGDFDGSTDYVALGGPTVLQATSSISMMLWVNRSQIVTYNPVGGNGDTLKMEDGGNGSLNCTVYTSNGGTSWSTPNNTFNSTSTWYQLGCIYNGSTMSIYINGVQKASTNATGTLASSSTYPWYIGAAGTAGYVSGYFYGSIDDTRIYNRALTASQILDMYNDENSPATFYTLGAQVSNSGSPTLGTSTATSITTSTVTLAGSITSIGNASATVEGFNYGTSTAYGFTASTTGSFGPGSFSQSLSGLTPSTTYHFQAFATNGTGTGTSTDQTFTTTGPPTAPTFGTSTASSITTSTVTLTGIISSTGNATATIVGFNYGTSTAYGFVASTTGNFGAGAFSQNLIGLLPGFTYHFQAFATNGVGTGTSTDQTFTTGALPVPPTLGTSTATSITTSTVTLAGSITSIGNASATVEGFNYGTSTAYGFTASTTGSFGPGSFSQSLSGLTPSTTYHFQAFATNGTGTGTSTDQTFTTNAPDTTPPTTPTNLNATLASSTAITLTWTASTDNVGVAGYNIYRNNQYVVTVNGSTTAYTNTGLATSTNYVYYVVAFDTAGNYSAKSAAIDVNTATGVFVDTTPPTAPTNLNATLASSTAITLTWTASTDIIGVAGYNIYRDNQYLTTISGASTTFTDTGLATSTDYVYYVDAFDAAGLYSANSALIVVNTATGVFVDTTPPTAPTNLTATVISSSSLQLTWTASTDIVGVRGYSIYRNYQYIGFAGATTTYVDTGLSTGVNYYYYVVAFDQVNNYSLNSGSVNANTTTGVVTTYMPPARARTTQMLGVYSGDLGEQPTESFEASLGRTTDISEVFAGTSDWSYMDTDDPTVTGSVAWLLSSWPIARQLQMSIYLIPTASATLEQAAAGDYNSHYLHAAQLLAARDPNMIIRVGWEMNGNWFPWSACADPQAYIGAFQQFVTTFRSVSPGFRFDWAPNVDTQDCAPDQAYPGDAYVNIIGQDIYEFAEYNGSRTTAQVWNSDYTGPYGIEWFQNFATAHNKPMSIPEWGTDNDDGYMMTQMISFIKSNNIIYQSVWNNTADTYAITRNPVNLALYKTAFGPDTQPPTVPTNVAPSTISTSQISLTWTPSTDNVAVDGYIVYRNAVQVGTTATSSFTDVGLSSGTTYNYSVAAYDWAGNISPSSSPIQATTQSSAPISNSPLVEVAAGGNYAPSTISPEVSTSTSTATNSTGTIASKPTSTASVQSSLKSLEAQLNTLLQEATSHPSATSAFTTVFTRNLTIGSHGADVAALQHFLNIHGFPVVSTPGYAGSLGYETQHFGANTQAALAKFQKSVGITPASGFFGPITRAYVNARE